MFTHAAFRLFDTTYPAYRVFMLLTAIAMFAALLAVVTRTRVGLIIQAALTRPDMVAMLGHNVRKIFMPVFGAGALALGCLLFRAALPGNSKRRVPPLSSQRGLRGRDPQRRGGCLVVSVPGADERGASVFERVLDHANAELATMVDQAAITAEERRRMALNVWPRRTSDLVAPFADGGRFRSLTLKATETRLLPDAAWVAYEKGCRKTCRPDFRSSSSMSLEKSKNIPLVK